MPELEPLGVNQVVAGYDHTCAILENGGLKCWGYNKNGQLGLGHTDTLGDESDEMGDDLPYVDLGEGRTAVQVALGIRHTCALLDNGDVKCWGENKSGQLGQGHDDDIGMVAGEMGDDLSPVDLGGGASAIHISAGREHSCALLDDTSVKCWGLNSSGQLGLGHTDNLGDDEDEMGSDLLPVPYTTNNVVLAVESGSEHNCALYEDGKVKCWGYNSVGQLGNGASGNYGDDDKETKGGEATANREGDPSIQISLSGDRTCVLSDDAEILCWGYDVYPRTRYWTDRENSYPMTFVSTGDSHTCRVVYDDLVQCYGANFEGQLGGSGLRDRRREFSFDGAVIAGLSLGSEHTCVVLDNGTARCWGLNGRGQLGQGTNIGWGDGRKYNEKETQNIEDMPPVDLGTR